MVTIMNEFVGTWTATAVAYLKELFWNSLDVTVETKLQPACQLPGQHLRSKKQYYWNMSIYSANCLVIREESYIQTKHTIFICIHYYSTYLSELDVHLFQIQIYCFKYNHTTGITLHKTRNYFLCILLNIHHIKKIFRRSFRFFEGLLPHSNSGSYIR